MSRTYMIHQITAEEFAELAYKNDKEYAVQLAKYILILQEEEMRGVDHSKHFECDEQTCIL